MKTNKPLFIILISAFIYAILGFVAVPKILKPIIVDKINENITQTASIENIKFNPFLLKFSINNLKISKQGTTTVSLKELEVDFSFFKSIIKHHIHFKDIKLVEPYANIIQYENNELNLNSLVKKQEDSKEEKPKEETKSSITFQIGKTILENAKIDFTKHEKDDENFTANINKLNYTFYDIGTYKHTLASHTLNILINKNTQLNIKGGLRLEPFIMYGNVELNNLRPSEFLPYVEDKVNFTLSDKAYLNLAFGYEIHTKNGLEAKIEDAHLNLHDFNMLQNDNSLLSFEDFALENLYLEYPKNLVSIDSIILKSLNTNINKDENQVLNLQTLVKNSNDKNEEEKKEEQNTSPSKPWEVNLASLSLQNINTNYEDRFLKQNIALKNTNLNVNDLNLKDQNVSITNIELTNDNLSFKDLKSKIDLQKEQLSLNLNNFKFQDKNIYINDNRVKIASINFKDLKNKANASLKDLNLNIKDTKVQDQNISVASTNLASSSISYNDLKNNSKVIVQNLKFDVLNTQVQDKNINIDNTNLQSSKISYNDLRNRLYATINNAKLGVKNTSLKDENIGIDNINLTNSSLILNDKKARRNINIKALNVNVNSLEKQKEQIKVKKVTLKEKSLNLQDLSSKLNASLNNLNLDINLISQNKNHLKIVSSSINQPYIKVVLGKQTPSKKTEEQTKTKALKTTSKSKNDFTYDIGPVKVKNARMYFEDKNLPIPFKTNITKLHGEFSELNSSNSRPTKLNLEGSVNQYGYTKITGTVDTNDVKLLTDTSILFKNLAIKNFSPYSSKFVGRKIDSGKLNLDLKYNIRSSDLNANNSIVISDIKLGDKVQSPDALDLPLDLAIALLENSDGIIDLNLPISGNVDDPQFSVGPIIWQVFTNLISKAITSPFRLLASAFGIEEDKIKEIDFEFGSDKVIISENEVLDNIAKVLNGKPRLAIKLSPTYDKVKDLEAIQSMKFEKIVQTKMKTIKEKDSYKVALEQIYLSQNDIKKLEALQKQFTKDKLNIKAYTEHLRKTLASLQKVSTKELEDLSLKRVANIKEYLIKQKAISEAQIIVNKDFVSKNETNSKWCVFDLSVDIKQ